MMYTENVSGAKMNELIELDPAEHSPCLFSESNKTYCHDSPIILNNEKGSSAKMKELVTRESGMHVTMEPEETMDKKLTSAETDELIKLAPVKDLVNHSHSLESNEIPCYVGESARTLRQRAMEHYSKARQWNVNSFILRHWMECHGTSPTAPSFEFKTIKSFNEPLGRQILEALMIVNIGTLNQKSEFGTNHLCRLQSTKSDWDRHIEAELEEKDKRKLERDIKQFVIVMSNVNKQPRHEHAETNESNVSRYNYKDKKRATPDTKREEGNSKTNAKRTRRMDYSTPVRGEA